MKIFIFSSIVLLILCSCRTAKQVIPAYGPVIVKEQEHKSVEKETITRIDTVTVFVEVPAQKAERITGDSVSHLETDFAVSDAWINCDGSLGHMIENKPRKIPIEAYVPATDTNTHQEIAVIKEVPVPYPEPFPVEKKLTTWEKVKIGAFWYLLSISLVGIVWVCRKPIISLVKKCF